ncbi:hypothetical protein Mgra_00007709 [Meloidogyne graminicola]|uniref:Uncharacterized protein n=1 Tax=Meloidogyne graminicola TaxID=189291 RepID=A0A8S9ZI16_9BILA|nr:hypothetical protein Mgra_00007709 [Meloidogyne graminicola]
MKEDELKREEKKEEEKKIRRKGKSSITDHQKSLGWTQWTECRISNNKQKLGIQSRWKVCTGSKVCGRKKNNICRSQDCCPILGSCHLGIQFKENGKNANWCKILITSMYPQFLIHQIQIICSILKLFGLIRDIEIESVFVFALNEAEKKKLVKTKHIIQKQCF